MSNIKSTGSFGVVPGTTILAQLQLLVPTFLATLSSITVQEPDWAAINGGNAVVLNWLESLKTAYNSYFDVLVAAEPLLQKASAVAIKTQLMGVLTSAIAAYTK
ncbi:hypothetical protein NLG97_g2168 [Lecanicillium saksenae]|uniref:Uncharacterized protein n=1 Tax=Lecanicillium saksenae TaxID=468837 RepID=A0ACC1R2X5_9HYPO|nr:hypothetical protein NLG97_g2168 [Lecanicillium saksenae]